MGVSGVARIAGVVALILTESFTGLSTAQVLGHDSEQPTPLFSQWEQPPDPLTTEGLRIETGYEGFKPSESKSSDSVWTSPISKAPTVGDPVERVKEPGSFALLGLGILALLLLGRVGRRH